MPSKKTIMGLLTKLRSEERGVAYIEFALALPFLLLLFAGSVDVTRMVLLHQKVDKAVFTVGDLATQLQIEKGVCSKVAKWEKSVVKDMIKPFDYEKGGFQFVMSSVIGAHPDNNPKKALQDLIEWRYNAGVSSIIGKYNNPYKQVAKLPKSIKGLRQSERVIVTEMQYTFNPLLPAISNLETTNFRKVSYFQSRTSTGNEGRNKGMLSKC